MSTGGRTRILRHGTTRRRAEAILKNGPDLNFQEPGAGSITAEGFSAVPIAGPFPLGTAEEYARRKAKNFPDEGGPVLVEFEVPEEILLADTFGGDFRFTPEFGLKELLEAWPILPKRIVEC